LIKTFFNNCKQYYLSDYIVYINFTPSKELDKLEVGVGYFRSSKKFELSPAEVTKAEKFLKSSVSTLLFSPIVLSIRCINAQSPIVTLGNSTLISSSESGGLPLAKTFVFKYL